MTSRHAIEWPEGKDFAFTVFDDTDLATVANVAPVYRLLDELGFRTTKSVWPIRGAGTPRIGGDTCEDPAYRRWTLELQAAGFEIGYHGATYLTSPREQVMVAMERFREIYGRFPDAMANHSDCGESIYWGPDRVSGLQRLAYNLMTRFSREGTFRGHRQGDPLFWGDICQADIRYVRNFTYAQIDTLAACPVMPYHDPQRPYVNRWFASSEGGDVGAFDRCVSEAGQDALAAAGGACIMYTHFARGFATDGTLEPRFRALMERLSGMNGWFVPVTTLLDHLAAEQGVTILTAGQRGALERRWLMSKVRTGYS